MDHISTNFGNQKKWMQYQKLFCLWKKLRQSSAFGNGKRFFFQFGNQSFRHKKKTICPSATHHNMSAISTDLIPTLTTTTERNKSGNEWNTEKNKSEKKNRGKTRIPHASLSGALKKKNEKQNEPNVQSAKKILTLRLLAAPDSRNLLLNWGIYYYLFFLHIPNGCLIYKL